MPLTSETDASASYLKDPNPIFSSIEQLRNIKPNTVKNRFDSQLNRCAAPFQHTATGARTISSFTVRKCNASLQNVIRCDQPQQDPYPEEIIKQYIKMPDGRSKNEIFSTLANNNTVSDEWKVRCDFAMSKSKAEAGENPADLLGKKDYSINHNRHETIKKLAQNEILEPNFRAYCILEMPAGREKISLAENLLKQKASCNLYYQARLVLTLNKGLLKQQTIRRLAQEENLNTDLRNILIFKLSPGPLQDGLLIHLIQSSTPSLGQKIAAAAFIQDPTQRNNNLIHLHDCNLFNLEAIANCALLMDPGEEKTKRLATVKIAPGGKEHLNKAYTILRKNYPFIEDLDTLGTKAKIEALYPGSIKNEAYHAFLTTCSTSSQRPVSYA